MVEMRKSKFNSENIAYLILWAIIFAIPVSLELMETTLNEPFLWQNVFFFWTGLLPFVVLFVLHNLAVKKLLFQSESMLYIIVTAALFLAFFIFVWQEFEFRAIPPPGRPMPPPLPDGEIFPFNPPVFHLVVLTKGASALMMIGFNLAISQMYKSLKDKARQAELERYQMQMELKSLKAQVSPHFLMNMLNNIHACVEIDTRRAQTMIIELSRLMRYVLYDAERSTVSLTSEVQFIGNYISMMSNRYSPDKIAISCYLPDKCSPEFMVPPLVFIPFVENCFKHGISYLNKSEINISIREEDGFVCLKCSNYKLNENQEQPSGVGLENVRKRLNMLYGDKYTLDINDAGDKYDINLIIPSL